MWSCLQSITESSAPRGPIRIIFSQCIVKNVQKGRLCGDHNALRGGRRFCQEWAENLGLNLGDGFAKCHCGFCGATDTRMGSGSASWIEDRTLCDGVSIR